MFVGRLRRQLQSQHQETVPRVSRDVLTHQIKPDKGLYPPLRNEFCNEHIPQPACTTKGVFAVSFMIDGYEEHVFTPSQQVQF